MKDLVRVDFIDSLDIEALEIADVKRDALSNFSSIEHGSQFDTLVGESSSTIKHHQIELISKLISTARSSENIEQFVETELELVINASDEI